MNSFNTIMLLVTAYLAVFLQSTFNEWRGLFGAQVDLLPGLVVYTALTSGHGPLALLSTGAGLFFDSLSANSLGTTVLPLFLVGFVIRRYRALILREQLYAQLFLGLIASAATPALTVLLLLVQGQEPLVGWFSFWQWLVMGGCGAAITPLWFAFFDRVNELFNYRPIRTSSFRADREIKRGRQ